MSATTDHDAIRRDYYRVAVELNNIGVCLLESLAYRSAIDALKGSVEVMKQVVCPGFCGSQPFWIDQAIYCYTLNARRRLAELQKDGLVTSNAYLYSRGEGFQVKQDQAPSEAWGDERPPAMSNPILIDASVVIEDDLNPDLESAILFHNLALAELQGMNAQVVDQRIFLQGALDLFEMAYSITLLETTDSLLNMSLDDIQELGATRVFLAIVLLNSIIRIKEALGKHVEAHESCRHLVRLELAVLNQDEEMDYVEVSISAPAA